MTLILSERDFKQFWESSRFRAVDGFDTSQDCPKQLGKGKRRRIQLRHGIWLLIHDYEFQDHLVVEFQPGEQFCLEFGFQISGSCLSPEGYHRRAGENFISLESLAEGTMQRLAAEKILQVDIHLESPSFVWTLFEGHLDWLPQDLRRILEWSIELADGHPEVGEKLRSHLEDISQQYHYGLGAINSAMQLALQQLLNCPYHGFTKQLYLESKAMELIALRLEQLKEQVVDFNPPSNLPDRFQGDDIDRIHHARDILVDNLDDPPSLLELARQVGLNDYKLKRGFRYCFGTTAFGYLHDYRMEQARQLLLERQMQVNEVARAVGYASRSSFATAFRKKFGVSPKAIAL